MSFWFSYFRPYRLKVLLRVARRATLLSQKPENQCLEDLLISSYLKSVFNIAKRNTFKTRQSAKGQSPKWLIQSSTHSGLRLLILMKSVTNFIFVPRNILGVTLQPNSKASSRKSQISCGKSLLVEKLWELCTLVTCTLTSSMKSEAKPNVGNQFAAENQTLQNYCMFKWL